MLHRCVCPWQRSLDWGLQWCLKTNTSNSSRTSRPNCVDREKNLRCSRRGIRSHRREQHVSGRGGVLLGCCLVRHVQIVHGRCRAGGASGGRGSSLGSVYVPRDRATVQHFHLPELGFSRSDRRDNRQIAEIKKKLKATRAGDR
jgi:hypothetical protein